MPLNKPSTANDLQVRWGRRIRTARLRLGLSLGYVAREARIKKPHLSLAERGLAGLGDEARIRLARVLGQQVASLFPYPDTTDLETACPSAASATGAASSPTPATTAGPRSRARSVEGPGESGREENPGNE